MRYPSSMRAMAPSALLLACAAAAALASPPASITRPAGWQVAATAPPHGKQVSLADYALVGPGFIQNIDVHMAPMMGATFQSFVADRVRALAQSGTVLSSHAEKLCDAKINGWFIDYKNFLGPRAVEVEQTLAADVSSTYMASYTRAVDQPENGSARAALDTLCVPLSEEVAP